MADVGIVQAGKTAVNTATEGSAAVKAGPSKFDEIRSQLAEKVATDLKLPPAQKVSDPQKADLESSLRKQLSSTAPSTPRELFGPEMKNTALNVQRLTDSVNKLPTGSAFGPIRDRLDSIATQFQKSGQLIDSLQNMDPQSLLNVQMQLYEMNQNVELLSKVVDQVTSGAKTILQTQVG